MDDKITKEKLEKYFSITKKALKMAEESSERIKINGAKFEIVDMVTRYLKDAKYFMDKDDYVNAFACLNYAHGWLDAGARIGIFDVKDSTLFTVD